MNVSVQQKPKNDAKPARVTKEAVAKHKAAKEPKAEGEGRKLKYNREQLIQLWEKGLTIAQIAEKMAPISKVFVHRTLVTHFPKQYQAGQEARSAARKAAAKEATK
jgi:hypothetical protein